MADLKDFAEQLVNLTVKEVNELADILKEEYGIEPDVMTLAKGLGYGVPIGAFMSKESCMAFHMRGPAKKYRNCMFLICFS